MAILLIRQIQSESDTLIKSDSNAQFAMFSPGSGTENICVLGNVGIKELSRLQRKEG